MTIEPDPPNPSAPANLLRADIADIQESVASLPDLDTRSPEDIIGYDEAGLPS
jgi:hypothetical protein